MMENIKIPKNASYLRARMDEYNKNIPSMGTGLPNDRSTSKHLRQYTFTFYDEKDNEICKEYRAVCVRME